MSSDGVLCSSDNDEDALSNHDRLVNHDCTLSWDNTLCGGCRFFWDETLQGWYRSADKENLITSPLPWHHDVHDMAKAIAAGCRMCIMVEASTFKDKEWPRGASESSYSLSKTEHDNIRLLLRRTDEDGDSRDFGEIRIIEGQFAEKAHSVATASSITIAKIKAWMKICQGHNFCNAWRSIIGAASRPPTRLLKLENGRPPRIRLLDTTMTSTPYASLSHCWGERLPLMLLSSNLESFQDGIDFDVLPNTFKDTITLCLNLGIDLLWIDALCIVQDDIHDWEREASRMIDVYANSTINISADHASNSSGGLFVDRDPKRVQAFEVVSRSDEHWTCWPDHLWDDLDRCATRWRAWIVQERFLSPRVVHFGLTQVYWECACRSAVESLVADKEAHLEGIINMKVISDETKTAYQTGGGQNNIYKAYHKFSTLYSQGRLTFQTDRPVAFAGIARAFFQHLGLPSSDYLCGLWRPYLAHDLVWEKVEYDESTDKTVSSSIAPSWSWLATKGSHFERYSPAEQDTTTTWMSALSLLSSNLSFLNDDPFNQYISGSLEIKAPLCRTLMSRESPGWDGFDWAFDLDFDGTSLRAYAHNIDIRLDKPWPSLVGTQPHLEVFIMLCLAAIDSEHEHGDTSLQRELYIPGKSYKHNGKTVVVTNYIGLLLIKSPSESTTLHRIGRISLHGHEANDVSAGPFARKDFYDSHFQAADIPTLPADNDMLYTFRIV